MSNPISPEFSSGEANFFNELLTLKDKESMAAFILKRKQEMQISEKKKIHKMDFLFDPMVSGFFDETVSIAPGFNEQKYFIIDDDEIYQKLIEYSQKINDAGRGKDNDLLKFLTSVQYASNYYFGNFGPISAEKRSDKFDTAGEATYSISHEKENAECSERAAVAHNMLLFLGLDSRYAGGHLNEIVNDDAEQRKTSELHNFLIVKYDGGEYLYDPTNPMYLFGPNNQVISWSPYIIEIDHKGISTGTKISGKFANKKENLDGSIEETIHSDREYCIGR